jgi:hypothetical protein
VKAAKAIIPSRTQNTIWRVGRRSPWKDPRERKLSVWAQAEIMNFIVSTLYPRQLQQYISGGWTAKLDHWVSNVPVGVAVGETVVVPRMGRGSVSADENENGLSMASRSAPDGIASSTSRS